ncbi:putative glycosyl transferase [Rosistilla ulvae]|uniref:Putative glycosyl transferase n=1 Tax=Rosistilla ulvae TaxID=1930277 RepID=A0A517LWP8_9BACT|nr:glycosyltransferase family 4 protein [Rosistilla ulvae]QDS87041.1 putative glycosyl transferase [Rosistilla ulvae]
MKFWVIHAQENPPESKQVLGRREWRSNTLAEYLAERGHEVTRWRSAFSHQSKLMLTEGSALERFEGYDLQYIDCPKYAKHVGVARIRNHRSLASNFATLAGKRAAPPDLIHVCNVPIELCASAVAFGKRNNVPVVVDVRDLWPDIYVDFIPERLNFLKPIAKTYLDRCSRRVKYAFQHATAITALTESYLDWGLNKARRRRQSLDEVFPMCYPRLPKDLDATGLADLRNRLGVDESAVLACYIGNIGYQSDFETVIESARMLASKHPNFKIVLAGSGPRVSHLKDLAKGLPNVVIPGWLSSTEVHRLMTISSIGLIAYKCVPNFMLNIPNKFSEYLAGGLAIASAIDGEMGKLVRQHNCGFVYREGDSLDLARRLGDLLNNNQQVDAFSAASTKLHETQFDGARIFPDFCAHLESIANPLALKASA